MRSHVLLPALLSFTSLAAAVPACLLGALGPQENPSDVEAVCGKDKQEALLAKLVEVCSGDALTDAYAQIVDTCGEKGIEVGMFMLFMLFHHPFPFSISSLVSH